jgi:hypothetical protein
MLSHIYNSASSTRTPNITFLYTTKAPSASPSETDNVLFSTRLQSIEASLAGQMNLKFFITGGKESINPNSTGAKTFTRRIEERDLESAVGDERNGTLCFVCGPPDMTDIFVDFLGGLIGKERVFCEKWW